MHEECDIMRAVGPWEELHHHPTGALFYFNSDTDLFLGKARRTLDGKKTKRGTDLVKKSVQRTGGDFELNLKFCAVLEIGQNIETKKQELCFILTQQASITVEQA